MVVPAGVRECPGSVERGGDAQEWRGRADAAAPSARVAGHRGGEAETERSHGLDGRTRPVAAAMQVTQAVEPLEGERKHHQQPADQ